MRSTTPIEFKSKSKNPILSQSAALKATEAISNLHQSPIFITNGDPLLHHNDGDDDDEYKGLIRRKRILQIVPISTKERIKPYWLSLGLFLLLFAFWLLDSLKDPIFAILVDGKLNQHQPPAKLFSVATTLILVSLLELGHHARTQQKDTVQQSVDGWNVMTMEPQSRPKDTDRVSAAMFAYIGIPYAIVFALVSLILGCHPGFSRNAISFDSGSATSTLWHVAGYALYSIIDSFGSFAVATFWSYTNSTLSLHDAERFYGLIIAIAQVGAIGGSTMVTTHHWSTISLIWVACLVILLQVLVMTRYDKVYKPTSDDNNCTEVLPRIHKNEVGAKTPFMWTGVYLILRHNYVLLIMGVSCLYEVSLTCLDYQMKLLGWSRFEERHSGITFAQFMGRYGQLTNVTSLIISSMVFPYLIRRLGLRYTVRIFPTLLLIATVIVYGAAPGNLTVLFLSLSLLKAMTYSMHDPAKEILYIPTSNAIKFRAKFWIDVVGARVAKAVGSSINTLAGSVEGSVRIGSIPSFLTAGALWYVCYKVGIEFERLVKECRVVGQEGNSFDHASYGPVPTIETFDDPVGQLLDTSNHSQCMEMEYDHELELRPLPVR